jgi:hypothetical protein
MWLCSFVGYTGFVFHFLGAARDELLNFPDHFAASRATSGLKPLVCAGGQIKT